MMLNELKTVISHVTQQLKSDIGSLMLTNTPYLE